MLVELNKEHDTIIKQNLQNEGIVVLKNGSKISGKSLANEKAWSDDQLNAEDFARIAHATFPLHDANTQKFVRNAGAFSGGQWIYGYDVIALTFDEIKHNFTVAIQKHLDAKAQAVGYDNINAIGKYLGYENMYKTECEALGAECAATWSYCYEQLAEAVAGNREIPTSVELFAELDNIAGL